MDRPPSPTSADGITLSGPSDLPDARLNAFRPDLADVALAGRVIASHYAFPVDRTATETVALRDTPSPEGAEIGMLASGDLFSMLDDTLGWAWGYAGEERRVGYVRSEALKAA